MKYVFQLILLLILLRIGWRFLKGVLEGAGVLPDAKANQSVGLVRDPVCGMFVVPSQALTLGTGKETRYFCSEKCRREYTGR
jgi:YHS domain-containing protein